MPTYRIDAIKAMTTPKSLHDLRVFLGACNGFRDNIPHYDEFVRPFADLLKKDSSYQWTETHQAAYGKLVETLSSDSILANGTEVGTLIVRADASDLATGGAILLRHGSTEQPVCYFSRSFSPTQCKWTVYEKELYAIICILTSSAYKQLLKMNHIIVQTDHKNLLWLDSKSQDNNKLARWRRILQEYDFTIEHIEGKKNCLADYLSRHNPNVTSDIMHESTKEALWISTQPLKDTPFLSRLRAEQKKEYEEAHSKNSDTIKYNQNSQLYISSTGMVIVPKSLVHEVIQAAHATIDQGHQGTNATKRAVKEAGYAWSGINKDVSMFIKGCPICQKYRHGVAESPIVAQGSTTLATCEPWHTVHVDTYPNVH